MDRNLLLAGKNKEEYKDSVFALILHGVKMKLLSRKESNLERNAKAKQYNSHIFHRTQA